MEWSILLIAVLLALLLAFVKSFQYVPSTVSNFELERLAKEGQPHAVRETERRALLPTLIALRNLKESLLIAALIALLVLNFEWWLGLLIGVVLLALAQFLVVNKQFSQWVGRLQKKIDNLIMPHAVRVAPVVRPLAPKQVGEPQVTIASLAELQQLVRSDSDILNASQKTRLLSALTFDDLTIADSMVPRERIITVDTNETVGPVLLDRLHKNRHNIFPAVKKDLDHIRGLLYMHDVVPSNPDIQKVEDAVRPAVHYLPQQAPLSAVVAASLQTGRQLFIVTDEQGNITGLITLSDALAKLLGQPIEPDSPVRTKQ